MKKIFGNRSIYKFISVVFILVMFACMALCMVGCNMDIIDTHYNFDYAYVMAGDDILAEGPVEQWADLGGDQLQVTIGKNTYFSNSMNIILVDSSK